MKHIICELEGVDPVLQLLAFGIAIPCFALEEVTLRLRRVVIVAVGDGGSTVFFAYNHEAINNRTQVFKSCFFRY